MARLAVSKGPQAGAVFRVGEFETIGSGARNTIVISGPGIQDSHAEISRHGSGHVLRNINKTASVLVNGSVVAEIPLHQADMVSIGGVELVFDNSDDIDKPGVGPEAQQALARILKRLSSARLDCDVLLDMVAGIVAEATKAGRSFIVLLGEKGEFLFKAARNIDDRQIASPQFQVSHGIIREVAANGLPVLVEDAARYGPFKGFESVAALNIRSVLCVPVKLDNRIVGVVYLDNGSGSRPFSAADLRLTVQMAEHASAPLANAIELHRRARELEHMKDALTHTVGVLKQKYAFADIVGESPKLVAVLNTLARVSATPATVLIEGESGTGKELVAAAIHYNSDRKSMPFVPVNCAAMPEPLLDSELFGHAKGAFTGAATDRKGLLEVADGGTVFLDEISDMSPNLQAKLLRAVESGEVRRVGEGATRKVDVRFIAASNRKLSELAEQGKFRMDLYHRINVITIPVPPLRERKEDIPLLARHFLAKSAAELRKEPPELAPEALDAMTVYNWPGNIREFRNVIARGVILADAGVITAAELPAEMLGEKEQAQLPHMAVPVSGKDLRRLKRILVANLEKSFLTGALRRADGNISEAARLARMNRVQFQQLVTKHKLGSCKTRNESPQGSIEPPEGTAK
jgi:Nif-specific regulatory protein